MLGVVYFMLRQRVRRILNLWLAHKNNRYKYYQYITGHMKCGPNDQFIEERADSLRLKLCIVRFAARADIGIGCVMVFWVWWFVFKMLRRPERFK